MYSSEVLYSLESCRTFPKGLISALSALRAKAWTNISTVDSQFNWNMEISLLITVCHLRMYWHLTM